MVNCFSRLGTLKRLSLIGVVYSCACASQVFEQNIVVDPGELRIESSSVERLEQANKYLKDMAYNKVRDLGVCDDCSGCKYHSSSVDDGTKGRIFQRRCAAFRRGFLSLWLNSFDPFGDL